MNKIIYLKSDETQQEYHEASKFEIGEYILGAWNTPTPLIDSGESRTAVVANVSLIGFSASVIKVVSHIGYSWTSLRVKTLVNDNGLIVFSPITKSRNDLRSTLLKKKKLEI